MVSSNSAYEAAQVARLQAVELVDDWVSPDYVEEGEEEEEAASRMEGGMGELAGDEMPMDYAYSQLPTVSEEEEGGGSPSRVLSRQSTSDELLGLGVPAWDESAQGDASRSSGEPSRVASRNGSTSSYSRKRVSTSRGGRRSSGENVGVLRPQARRPSKEKENV